MQPDPIRTELSTHSYEGVCFSVFKRQRRTYATPAADARCQRTDYRLNLPTVHDLANSVYTVFAQLDATNAHLKALQTYGPDTHPTFKRVHGLARQAIYETMTKEPIAYPRHADYLKAQDIGVDLKPSPPMLTPWRPNTADPDLQPLDLNPTAPASPDAYLCEPAAFAAPLAQSLWHALVKNNLDTQVFFPNEEAEGYPWYQDLPTITEAACLAPQPLDMTSRSDTLLLTVETRVRTSPQAAYRSLPIDVFFPTDGFDFHLPRPREQRFLLIRNPDDLTREDLATSLVGAYFESDTDAAADGWSTQLSDAENHAQRTATTLLDGEDTAFKETAALTVQTHLNPYLPEGKVCTITLRHGEPVAIDLSPTETGADTPKNT